MDMKDMINSDIFKAAEQGDVEEVVKLLDANPHLLHAEDHRRDEPLARAAQAGQLEVVKLLLQRGAYIDAWGGWGKTVLQHAAEGGHEEVVAFLLSKGVKADDLDDYDRHPIMLAAYGGHLGVVQLLVQAMDKKELDHTDAGGFTALHHAAGGPHEDVVAFLLSEGADSSIGVNEKWTPLMIAVRRGALGMVKLLVEHGGQQVVEHRDFEEGTALHWAATWDQEEIAAFLLSQGADACSRDDQGRTPLDCACVIGRLGVVQLLLQHMDAQGLEDIDDLKHNALCHAAESGHEKLVTFLLRQGAEPYRRALKVACLGGCSRVVQVLLQHMGAEGLAETDEDGEGVLHWAVSGGHEGLTRVLLLAGAGQGVDLQHCLHRPQEADGQCEMFEWWEGELERGYLLQRARCLHDTVTTRQDDPTAPVPAFLQARAAAGQALPQVEVVPGQQEEEQEAGASGKRKASSEAGSTQDEEEEEERHAVLTFVATTLGDQLVTELMQGFHPLRSDSWADGGDASDVEGAYSASDAEEDQSATDAEEEYSDGGDV